MARLEVAILVIPCAIILIMSPASGFEGKVGGRTEVRDVKTNKEVQELGRFSVEEFNKQLRHHGNGGEQLVFSEVVEAEKQVVAGIKYYMKIVATNQNGETKVFYSVVVVKSWLHSRELINFEPASASELRRFKKRLSFGDF